MPSSSHGGVEIFRNSPAITRHFASPKAPAVDSGGLLLVVP